MTAGTIFSGFRPDEPGKFFARFLIKRWGLADIAAVAVLLLVYSPFVTYDFGWHIDYYVITKPYIRGAAMYNDWREHFFMFVEAPYLIRIGRLINAVLVSLQIHFHETVAALRYVRGAYLVVLVLTYFGMARLFRRHFEFSPMSARLLALLLVLTPPMQQGVFMVTFSAPFFVAFWTAVASYTQFVSLLSRPPAGLGGRARGLVGPIGLMIVSLSCYAPTSMFFLALALLELTVASRPRILPGVTAVRFTMLSIAFIFVSLAAYFLIDRLIFLIFFASNATVTKFAVTPFYSFSLDFVSLSGFGNRLHNFWLSFHNAITLWDQQTHRTTIVLMTALLGFALVQPSLRWILVSMVHGDVRHGRLAPSALSGAEVIVVVSFLALPVLVLLWALPSLIPEERFEWLDAHADAIDFFTGAACLIVLARTLWWGRSVIAQRGRQHSAFWRLPLAQELKCTACRFALLLLTILPFLIPSIRAEWANGYRDSFRTLLALEAGIVFLIFDGFRQLPFTVLAVSAAKTAGQARRAIAFWTYARIAGCTVLVALASAGAYYAVNTGAIWASVQYEFYESIYDRLLKAPVSKLVGPCDNRYQWLWDSPGIRGEFGYTSIQWERYIVFELAKNAGRTGLEVVCGWDELKLGERTPYLKQEGDALYVDYVRFMRDYSLKSSKQGWRLRVPPRQHDFPPP